MAWEPGDVGGSRVPGDKAGGIRKSISSSRDAHAQTVDCGLRVSGTEETPIPCFADQLPRVYP